MKKRILIVTIFTFYSFIYSQKRTDKCLDITTLKSFDKKTEEENKYITKYLDQIEGRIENKSLFSPMNTLYFNENCDFPNYYEKIRFSLEILKLRKNSKLIIETNTDSYEYKENSQLNLKRGKLVKEIFMFYGILPNRISIVDNKDEYPIADNETEEGRKSNRRVELRIPNYL